MPEETFEERFEEFLLKVKGLGFNAVDLYTAQIGAGWASEAQITTAKNLLEKHQISVPSLAGGCGKTVEAVEASCRFAQKVGAGLLSGGTPLLTDDPEGLQSILIKYEMAFALENHPEKSAAEHMDKIKHLDPQRFGLAIDTGWYATQGVDSVAAIRENADRLLHVHLKDVLPKAEEESPYYFKNIGHETCALGDGIVNIPAVLKALRKIGFEGPISIEHEPEEYDPSEECRVSLERVHEWWG
jgi:sugar phosphate isomerase/epimerase